VARRPLEREQIYLDGGRRTMQLMRDSLGSGSMRSSPCLCLFLTALLMREGAQQARQGYCFPQAEAAIGGIRLGDS